MVLGWCVVGIKSLRYRTVAANLHHIDGGKLFLTIRTCVHSIMVWWLLSTTLLVSDDDMTEDCIGMVIAIFGYYFSINNINATQRLYYTADK